MKYLSDLIDIEDIPHYDPDTDLCTNTLDEYERLIQSYNDALQGRDHYEGLAQKNADEASDAVSQLETLKNTYDGLKKAWDNQSVDCVAMDKEIASLKSSKTRADSKISKLMSDATTLRSTVSTLEDELANKQATIDNLQSDLAKFMGDPQSTANTIVSDLRGQLQDIEGKYSSLSDYYRQLNVSYKKAKENFELIMGAFDIEEGNFSEVSNTITKRQKLTARVNTQIQSLAIQLKIPFENKVSYILMREISQKITDMTIELADLKLQNSLRTANSAVNIQSSTPKASMHKPIVPEGAQVESSLTRTGVPQGSTITTHTQPVVTQPKQVEPSSIPPTGDSTMEAMQAKMDGMFKDLQSKLDALGRDKKDSKGKKILVPPTDLVPTATDKRLKEDRYMDIPPDFNQTEKIGKVVINDLGKHFSDTCLSLFNKWMEAIDTNSFIYGSPAKFLALYSSSGEVKKILTDWHAQEYTWVQIKWLLKETYGPKHVYSTVTSFLRTNKQNGRTIEVFITSTTKKLREMGMEMEDLSANQKDLFLSGLDNKQMVRDISSDLCKEYSDNYPIHALITAMRQEGYSQTHYDNIVKGSDRVYDTLAIEPNGQKQRKGNKFRPNADSKDHGKPRQSPKSPPKQNKSSPRDPCECCNKRSHTTRDCFVLKRLKEEEQERKDRARARRRDHRERRNSSSRDPPNNARRNSHRSPSRDNQRNDRRHGNSNHSRGSSPTRDQNNVNGSRGNSGNNRDQGNER